VSSQKPVAQDSKSGEILQASTTVASLAVAVVVLLPSIVTPTSLISLNVGGLELSLSLGLALLLCGICALTASLWALDAMRREVGLPFHSLVMARNNISWLFIALCLFIIIYLGVLINYLRK
jgi:hypothetical protein